MITITRRTARRLRAVLRRSVLGISRKGTILPLMLKAENQQLRVQLPYHDLAVEYLEPTDLHELESIPIPLEALADVEGRDDSPVMVESPEPDRIVIRWQDRGIPQTREYPIELVGQVAPFPKAPTVWTKISADVLMALADAAVICTAESLRYALDCIQLRGTVHTIVATDSCQLLIRSGFGFPWDGDLLIRGSPIFACKAFRHDQPIQVGKTESHVVFRIGSWTLWHEIQKGGRFPRVEDAIPNTETVTTRLELDSQDAEFLKTGLARLPGADVLHAPVTIDCNGNVALRARGSDTNQVTELVLNQSRYSGPAIRVSTSRAYLVRALELCFHELAFSSAELPVVCREQYRIYAWQPLNADSVIEAVPDATCIDADDCDIQARHSRTDTKLLRRAMSNAVQHNGLQAQPASITNVPPPGDNPGTSLTALIQDAEALHRALTEARLSVSRLITGLRRHRKHSRLLFETVRSLRELKLTEVAE